MGFTSPPALKLCAPSHDNFPCATTTFQPHKMTAKKDSPQEAPAHTLLQTVVLPTPKPTHGQKRLRQRNISMVRITIVASSSPSTQCLKRIRNTIEVRTLRHSTKGCQSLAAPVAIWMRLLISPDHPSGENAVVSFTVLVSMRCSHGTDTSFLSSLSTVLAKY